MSRQVSLLLPPARARKRVPARRQMGGWPRSPADSHVGDAADHAAASLEPLGCVVRHEAAERAAAAAVRPRLALERAVDELLTAPRQQAVQQRRRRRGVDGRRRAVRRVVELLVVEVVLWSASGAAGGGSGSGPGRKRLPRSLRRDGRRGRDAPSSRDWTVLLRPEPYMGLTLRSSTDSPGPSAVRSASSL